MSGAALLDVVEVVTEANYQVNDDVLNVYQFMNVGAAIASDADLLDDLEEVVTALLTVLKALATAYTTWNRFRVRNITQDGATLEREFAAGITGTAAGSSAPPGAAGLVTFHTEVPRVNLRKYWGPVAVGLLTTSGYLNGTAVGITGDLADDLMALYNTTLSSWSYGYLSPVAVGWVSPQTAVVTNNVAYQRRRRPGTGS